MHSSNFKLKYRTFDQLFEDVSIDFKNYTLEGVVEPQTLLKVARRCNYDLGFRIYRTRSIILQVENGRVRLPDDFHILNYALVCGESSVTEALPQGTHMEERLVAPDFVCEPGQPTTCAAPPDPCDNECDVPDPCNGTCLTKCGDDYQVIQKINTRTRTFKYTYDLFISDNEQVQCECPNTMWKGSPREAHIKDGFLVTNFDTGNVYLNYMGDMIDDDGNILVPDHEMINEFYEYALKERILENLIMNGENVGSRYELIASKLRASRNNAFTIVNTPNFKELQKIWQVNRKAQYSNYYDMFKSYHPYSYNKFGYQR